MHKVLIVDDSPSSQELMKSLLKSHNFLIESAWGGEDFLKKVQSFDPDCILMDVILPDADGKQLISKFYQNSTRDDVAVIFTTNTVPLEDDKGNEAFTIDGKVYRAFAKPLHPQKLVNVIRKEINRAQQGGELSPKILKQPSPDTQGQ